MLDKASDWLRKRFPRESQHMIRLWAASWRISRPITIAAIILISIPAAVVAFFVGKQFTITTTNTNIYMPPNTVPQPAQVEHISKRQWQPLSSQEAIALRANWRAFGPQHLGVLCAIPACADLAESIYDVAKDDLDWPAIYASTYFADTINSGIEIWSYHGAVGMRDKIADSLEQATNGRLKISSHEWPNQTPPTTEMANTINLVIGRFK
jgi:hypothetical protein